MTTDILKAVNGAKTIAVSGHTRPDGDCVGSCLGTYLYLTENMPELSVDLYLEEEKGAFGILPSLKDAKRTFETDRIYDLLILLDISSADRIGVASEALKTAKKVIIFDHHKTNRETCDFIYNDPAASSASEVVSRFMEMDKISVNCASALYTGIVHDTGVFRYDSTSPDTMRLAAALMEKGIDASTIISETFYKKTYLQNFILGKTLSETRLVLNGKVIVGKITSHDKEQYGIKGTDVDGIVSQMNNTFGVDVSLFMFETEPETWKVSLRSVKLVDVSRVAGAFGGGGHIRAAGCTVEGNGDDLEKQITSEIAKQL